MYKYDLHVHTAEVSSCGQLKAEQVIKLYKKAGFEGLVITDHFTEGYFHNLKFSGWEEKIDQYMLGYRKAFKAGKKEKIKVLFAMELSFNQENGDFLVYGINEDFLKTFRSIHKGDLKDFKKIIEGKDILIYQAHPFRSKPANPQFLDGMEVYNGNPRHNNNNEQAFKYARKHQLKMISGSDCHQLEDVATGGIIVKKQISDENQLVKVLKNNQFDLLYK